MNLGEAKQLLYETVARYHPGAVVVWEKTKGVTPRPPYITLGYGNINRSLFRMSDEKGEHEYYEYSFTFEMNLYTIGKELKVNGAGIGAYENTAVEDLEEFIRFLDSEAITNELTQKGLSVFLNPPIRDLSELIGDTKFNYRSMAEFTVAFVGCADGMYGVWGDRADPNASGGGAAEFFETAIEPVEYVDIQYGKEQEE